MGSSLLGNEITSHFSNALFQKDANKQAENFLNESEQRPGQGERRKLVANCCPHSRSHTSNSSGAERDVSKWGCVLEALSLSKGKGIQQKTDCPWYKVR